MQSSLTYKAQSRLRWYDIRRLMRWAAQGHIGVRVGMFCEDYPSLQDRQISKLGRLWASGTRVVEGSGVNLVGRVGNRTPYGPYVQDPERQKRIHKGRWKTTDRILADNADTVNAVLGQAGGRIVEQLAS